MGSTQTKGHQAQHHHRRRRPRDQDSIQPLRSNWKCVRTIESETMRPIHYRDCFKAKVSCGPDQTTSNAVERTSMGWIWLGGRGRAFVGSGHSSSSSSRGRQSIFWNGIDSDSNGKGILGGAWMALFYVIFGCLIQFSEQLLTARYRKFCQIVLLLLIIKCIL